MRELPSAFSTLLAEGRQVEPVIRVAITVRDGGSALVFADRSIIDGEDPTRIDSDGRVLEVAGLEEAQRSDSSGSAGSVTILLDDRDGSLKALFDANDLHKRPVVISQGFWGVEGELPVFAGVIGSPIIWNEGQRTFQFDVVSSLEDGEVGFSAEMGTYETVAQELLGRPWPMVFGTVHHSPCLRLQNIPTAFTTSPFGVVDRTLDIETQNLQALLDLAIMATMYYSLLASESNPSDPLDFEGRVHKDSNVKKYIKMQVDIREQMQEIADVSSWQTPYARGSTGLVPTVFVTQPYTGPFRVGDGLFQGTLNRDGGTLYTEPLLEPGPPAAASRVKEGFQFYNAGSQAVIAGPYPLKYVASVVPGTVRKVWAMRSFNGLRQMAEVPASYYTISTEAIGRGMTATFVTLKKPLSTVAMLENENTQKWENAFGKSLPAHVVNQIDWEDELYVSFTSSIGPNAVDIMEWVIDNFSGNGKDDESFEAVRGAVDGLPMNFTLAANPSVMDFLADLAYQAKCAIFLREDEFHLIYLPGAPEPVDAITESDVLVDGLKVTTTTTEELVTKYRATFRPDYSPFFDEPVSVTVRYNIPKYGVHEESHDFYAYNNFAAVQSAVTWWVIRRSQTWKVLQARLLLTKLNLEVFDYVTLDFDAPYIADGPVPALVTKCEYDSQNKWVNVEFWCPVLLGEMKQSPYLWPDGADQKVVWPQYKEMSGGGAGGGLSSPQLPQSNPRVEPVGDLNIGEGGFWTNDDGGGVRPIDQGAIDGYSPPYLPQAMPISKVFPTTPLPATDPTQPYAYRDYPNVTLDGGGCFPGRVKEKIDSDENGTFYMMDVFTQGVSNKPTERKVRQLQIDKDDTIPAGSWTLVTAIVGTDDNGDPYVDYSMQVPVWLE